MDVDIPEVKAELTAMFERYEKALTTNDVETLDELFKNAPYTIRYGMAENLYGYLEIAAFRAARPSVGLQRTLEKPVITTFGRDFGTASTGTGFRASGARPAARARERQRGEAKGGGAPIGGRPPKSPGRRGR